MNKQTLLLIQLEKQKKNSKKYAGAYCLRTSCSELSEQEIWETYEMLTELEDTFRFMKSEL